MTVAGAVYFCGCLNSVGHYTYADAKTGKSAWPQNVGPWKQLDVKELHPHGGQDPTGLAQLTHKAGWTALGIVDRTIDSRPNSHATFATEGTFGFDDMVLLARTFWPRIIDRIEAAGPITPHEKVMYVKDANGVERKVTFVD